MDFLPYIVVWLLLVAIPLAAVSLSRRSSILPILSVALSLIALIVWYFARPATTASLTLAAWPPPALPAGWTWRVDEVGWQLTGIVLWLTTGFLVYLAAVPATAPSHPAPFFHHHQAVVGLLSAVVLPVIWSATPVTLVTSWTLSIIVYWTVQQSANPVSSWRHAVWLLAPVLLYCLAAAYSGTPATDALISSGWIGTAVSLALLAVALQIILPPLILWGTATGIAPAETTLLHLWLPLIGATLLARLVSAGSIPLPAGLLATLLGFMTLVAGVWLAWIRPAERGGLAAGLSLALSGLAFLTGIWVGAGPLAAAMRIMVLVSGALLLIEGKRVESGEWRVGSPQSKIRNPQLVALAVAFLAIAGLPPTAGFASLAPLVESWLNGGRIVFVLALILLLIPLLTILYRFTQRLARQPLATDYESARPTAGNRLVLGKFAPLLLVAGTLSLGGYSLDAATIGTWLALFVLAFGSLLLPHFLRQLDSLRAALREALTFRPLQGRLPVSLHRLVTQATDAVAEAYAILEGDTGLLLLLALLLLFWWIS